MKARLHTLWERVHTSFWFVPGLVIGAAVALSAFTLNLDRRVNEAEVNAWPLVFHDGVEGARSLLSAVSASMITVTGVTFSVMIVAFTLASSQFTPRLLRNFMRDVGSQVVLGIFIGTFAYCLFVLRVVGGPTGNFIPRISITCAFAMTSASIIALVYFIHHAASLIQAQGIIASIGRELDRALDPLYPEGLGASAPSTGSSQELPGDFAARAAEIRAPQSDYVEAIDADTLMSIAEERDLVLTVELRPGDFTVEGEVLARAYPAERVVNGTSETITGAFVFGPERTQTQDPEFVLSELVEIAVRALSPGINDPTTAMLCVDRLGAALARIAARPMPSAERYGSDGRLRIVAKRYGFRGLVEAALNPIRQYGRESVPVTVRLLETIARIAQHAQRNEDREVLLRQAVMIERGSREASFDPGDLEDVQQRFGAALAALGEPAPVQRLSAA
jgi:uncharacterized membrane protein